MGIEARKRIDDSYFGYNAVWFDRSNNQIYKTGFIPATFERPMSDNVMLHYGSAFKIDINIDIRQNPNSANLMFKYFILNSSQNLIETITIEQTFTTIGFTCSVAY